VIHFVYCHEDSSSRSAAKNVIQNSESPCSKIMHPHHKLHSTFMPSVPCFMSFHSTNIINIMQIWMW